MVIYHQRLLPSIRAPRGLHAQGAGKVELAVALVAAALVVSIVQPPIPAQEVVPCFKNAKNQLVN